jgi:DnaJ-class molecular chaperone
MSRMTEMCHAMHDYCNENYGPEDIPEYETCERCAGSGFSNHPDSGEICETCGGSGGVERDRRPRVPVGQGKQP